MEQEKKRQPEQEGDNAQDRKISSSLRENEKYLRKRLENCSDILIRPMRLGDKHKVDCLMAVSYTHLEHNPVSTGYRCKELLLGVRYQQELLFFFVFHNGCLLYTSRCV